MNGKRRVKRKRKEQRISEAEDKAKSSVATR